ncbi:hypothetical protein ID866_6761, partial [Astraeus odoratus]
MHTGLVNKYELRLLTPCQVAKYLHAPLTFHNNPPSSIRPRHRHRHVASQIAVDSSGREHMFLSFYVQSSPSSSATDKSQWNLDDITSLTYDDVKTKTRPLVDSAKRAFRYLSGEAVPPPELSHPINNEKQKEKEKTEEHLWGLTSLFKGLRGGRPAGEAAVEAGATWTEGEVHADLVRNDDGYFVFRYLLVDIPTDLIKRVKIEGRRKQSLKKDVV